mgnify:CR=1 FL=1
MVIWLADANRTQKQERIMNLREAQEGIEYIIKSIETDDDELDAFLFSVLHFHILI